MSSSSTPERQERLRQAGARRGRGGRGPPRAAAAQARRRSATVREGSWQRLGDGRAGPPGLLWIGFYLVAPLVIIVLVSFWTWTDAGFDKTFTTANYSELFHDRTYWDNMLSTVVTSAIAVVACLVAGSRSRTSSRSRCRACASRSRSSSSRSRRSGRASSPARSRGRSR